MSKNTAPAATPAVATEAATEALPPAPVVVRPPANCGCGCGQPTLTHRALFLSGHDARHAGNLGRALAEAPGDAGLVEALAGLSPALQAKVLSVQATAERKAAEKAAKVAAKAAAAKAYADALAAATA